MTSSPLVHLHNSHQYHQFLNNAATSTQSYDSIKSESNDKDNSLTMANTNKIANDFLTNNAANHHNHLMTNNFSSNKININNHNSHLSQFEIKENTTILNRVNGATPKRRLSYTNNNSPQTIFNLNNLANLKNNRSVATNMCLNNTSSIETTNLNELKSISATSVNSNASENNCNNSNESPFMLKRPSKENYRFTHRSNTNIHNSPYHSYNDSPKYHLNESFEALNGNDNNCESIGSVGCGRSNRGPIRSRTSLRRTNLFRYRTDPVHHVNSPQYNSNNNNLESMALNDISNQMKQQSHTSTCAAFNLNDCNLELMNADYSSNTNENEDEDREKLASLLNFPCEQNISNVNTNSSCFTNNKANEILNNDLNLYQHQQLIKQSLEIDAKCKNLIGDRSREHILPTIVSAKHQDLNCISPETLVDVLNGLYDEKISECIIIDSRYPYEYDGGHISTALNIFTQEKLGEELFLKRLHLHTNPSNKFTSSISTSCFAPYNNNNNEFNNNNLSISKYNNNSMNNINENKDGRRIVIFHCEFSSERGPGLLRFLRNLDRQLNENAYPNLYYPELYLLEGGYKSFYENFKLYCYPQNYKPMLHSEHSEDLRHFRSKARSDGCKYELYAKLLGVKRNGPLETNCSASQQKMSINNNWRKRSLLDQKRELS